MQFFFALFQGFPEQLRKLPTRKAAKRSRTAPQMSADLDEWHEKVRELSATRRRMKKRVPFALNPLSAQPWRLLQRCGEACLFFWML